LIDLFTEGSDPEGVEGPKPLIPTTQGRMEMHLGGRSHFERFRWGDQYTGKVQDVIRRDFAATMADAQTGKLRDTSHHLRILDATCDKFGIEDWKEFVPANLQKDVPGRLKHETTQSDDFNRTDSTGLGANWSNVVSAGMDVVSNQARGTNAAGGGIRVRLQLDVSSADHYAQSDALGFGAPGANNGPLARYATAADTNYAWLLRSVTPFRRLLKIVTGTATVLASDTTAQTTSTLRIECNGSSLKVYVAGVEITGLATTDSSITTGTRGGMQGQQDTTVGNRTLHDNFEISDLAVGGILYTQLERGVRGVNRGMYTQWGG
jgi:hypothetical protein